MDNALKHVAETVAIDEVWKDVKSDSVRYIQITEVFSVKDTLKVRFKGFAKPLWTGGRFPRNSSMRVYSLWDRYRKLTPEEVEVLKARCEVQDLCEHTVPGAGKPLPKEDLENNVLCAEEFREMLKTLKEDIISEIKEIFLQPGGDL